MAFETDLLHVFLDDDPTYLATSYALGEPATLDHFAAKQDAKGNAARRTGYNKTVHEVLNSLVPVGSTLHLWIDAVCINQEDLDESASRVALMGNIYGKARQVVVCFGDSDENTSGDGSRAPNS